MQTRLAGGERDAEVEEIANAGVELGVRGEGAYLVELAAETKRFAGVQSDRIEFVWQTVFAKSKQGIPVRVDADVDRRFRGQAAFEPVAGEGCTESPKDRSTGRFLRKKLRAADEA